jgi:PAS domain S-box-containing protein
MSARTRKRRPSRALRELAESKLAGGAAVDLEELTPDEIRGFVHELEVHRVELEIQNQELAAAQLAAEEAKERYRELYESAPIGYLTLDPEGAIVASNLFTCELLRVPRAQILGRKLSSFIAEGHQDRWHFARRALAESHERRSLELQLLLDDGSTLETQLVGSGHTETNGSLHLALLDVTELRGAERALRRAAAAASLAEQQERRKLASDLHDDAGQLLSLASLKLRGLGDGVTGEPARRFEELTQLLAEARRRITSLTFQLSPPLLHDVGLVAATRWLAEDIEQRYEIAVSVVANEELALDETARVTLFRAIRELLINVRKHSGVDTARVRIWSEGIMVRVAVEDRGVGLDGETGRPSFGRAPDGGWGGFGLLALRERLGQLGGTLEVGPGSDGAGNCVVASLPFGTRGGGSP